MRKLLWIGDAAVATGFARSTHHVLEALRSQWEVHVLGINYNGDPHPYDYPIYPCWPGRDGFGLGRTRELAHRISPDLVVIQNDPWNVPGYLRELPEGMPVAAVMPVDGKNCRLGYDLAKLEKEAPGCATLDLGIFWTKFGLDQARLGGYEGNAAVIPLGVDLEMYQPMDRQQARERLGIPREMQSAFIVGNVNRNQPRKRLDLTLDYFFEWRRRSGRDNAMLFLHVAPTGEASYDLEQLKRYCEPRPGGLIIVTPEIGQGAPEKLMPLVYNSFDLQMTTTQGEGWGLTTMEGMACGVPQLVPDWSALGEWPGEAVYKVPCPTTIATPNGINVIGGVPDKEKTIHALDVLYHKPSVRETCKVRGLEIVSQPEFRWEAIGQRFVEVLADVPARAEAVA